VPRARDFLAKYFGLKPQGEANNFIGFLRDDNGMMLTLTNVDEATEVKYPGAFHIGFGQESWEQVDAIHRCLKEDGCEVDPPSKQPGSWTVYFRAPGGFVIEVLSGL
jgi:lactoylglutathione lyase